MDPTTFCHQGVALPPVSMPFTAASDTSRSAFFRVSFVASTGPLSSRRAVDEKKAGLMAAVTPVRAATGVRDALAAGLTRVKSDMIYISVA
jgi:hypothetical protein